MPTLLTRAEVADLLRVSEECLRTWEQRGVGPSVIRISDRVARYSSDEVRDFLSRRREAPTGRRKDIVIA
jgi:DNA-binding transcriptional MerR regulator